MPGMAGKGVAKGQRGARAKPRGTGTKVSKGKGKPKGIRSGTKPLSPSATTTMYT